MKATTKPAPSLEGLVARVSALEAELARVKALAEGAQRSAYRMNERFESVFIRIQQATDVSRDPYDSKEPLDDAIVEEEGDRATALEVGGGA